MSMNYHYLTTMNTFLTMSIFQLWPGPRPPGACYERGGWRGGSCAQRGSLDTEGEDLLQVEMVMVMMIFIIKIMR